MTEGIFDAEVEEAVFPTPEPMDAGIFGLTNPPPMTLDEALPKVNVDSPVANQLHANYVVGESKYKDPDQLLRSIEISRKTGIPLELARTLPLEAVRADTVDELRAFSKDSPKLAEFFATTPENAFVAGKYARTVQDVEAAVAAAEQGLLDPDEIAFQIAVTLGRAGQIEENVGKLYKSQQNPFEEAVTGYRFSEEYTVGAGEIMFQSMFAGPEGAPIVPEEGPRGKELINLHETWGGRPEPANLASYITSGAAEQIPLRIAGLMRAPKHIAASIGTFVLGGLALGSAGPQALTPIDEAAIIPAAVLTGIKVGLGTSQAEMIFVLEAGHAYGEFVNLEDEDGNKIDPEIARAAAMAVGAMNTPMEFIGMTHIMKALPGGKKLTSLTLRKAAKEALSKKPVIQAIAAALGRITVSSSVEGATEMAQEIGPILGREVVQIVDQNFKRPDFDIGDFGNRSIDRMLEALKKGSLAAFGLSVGGQVISSPRIYADAREASRKKSLKERTKKGIEEAAGLKDQSPEYLQELLQRVGASDRMQVRGEDAAVLLVEPGMEKELAKIGVTAEQVNEASHYGYSIVYDSAAALTKMNPDHADLLMDESRVLGGQTQLGKNPTDAITEEIESRTELVDRAVKDNDQYVVRLREVRGDIEKAAKASRNLSRQLAAIDTKPKEYANQQIALWDQYARRIELEGGNALEFLNRLVAKFQLQTQAILKPEQGRELEQLSKPVIQFAREVTGLSITSEQVVETLSRLSDFDRRIIAKVREQRPTPTEIDALLAAEPKRRAQYEKAVARVNKLRDLDLQPFTKKGKVAAKTLKQMIAVKDEGGLPSATREALAPFTAGHRRPSAFQINKALRAEGKLMQEIQQLQKRINDTFGLTPIVDAEGIVQLGIEERPARFESGENNPYKPQFGGFARTFSQTFMDHLPEETFETFRREITRAVERAFELGQAQGSFPVQFFDKAIANVSDSPFRIAPAVKQAEKTVGALNLNSACPMFMIGNHGCYLDGCYVSGMGMGGNTINFYERAAYTGELLQVRDEDIDLLNSVGGIRVNGQGDLTRRQEGQFRDIIRHAEMRGLQLKVITKQDATLAMLQRFHSEGLDISGVQVQTSIDPYWIPITEDEIAGSFADAQGLVESFRRNPDNEAIAEAIIDLYKSQGREARVTEGQIYRKYGYSVDGFDRARKKYKDVRLQPRVVVGTPEEVVWFARNRPEMVQTWMHAAIRTGMYSDVHERVLQKGEIGNYTARVAVFQDENGEWHVRAQQRVERKKGEKVDTVYDLTAELAAANTAGDKALARKLRRRIDDLIAQRSDEVPTEVRQAYQKIEDHIKAQPDAPFLFRTLGGQLGESPSALCCAAGADKDACNNCISHCHQGSQELGKAPLPVKELSGEVEEIAQEREGVRQLFLEEAEPPESGQLVQQVGERELGQVSRNISEDFKRRSEFYQRDEEEGGIRRGSTVVHERGYLVSLFHEANLSTLQHEAGHVFLEEIRLLVLSGDASEQLGKDWETIKGWLEIKDDDQVITEKQHERWARTFEAYLLEGKAPTLKLENAFERFRQWLLSIYVDLKGLAEDAGFDVQLTDEVRGVFDRMLATESEMAESAVANRMQPLSDTEIENIGLTESEAQQVNEAIDVAIRRGKSKLIAERQAELPEMQKAWKEEINRKLDADPRYQAVEIIKSQPEDNPLIAAPGLRLASLKAEYKDFIPELRKRGLVAKADAVGKLPDVVADMVGFDDADALILELVDMPKRTDAVKNYVEGKTDEFLAHVPSDEAIIDTDAYSKAMDLLGTFLRKRTGARGREKAEWYRSVAERHMAGLSTREILNTRRWMGDYQKNMTAERNFLAQGLKDKPRDRAERARLLQKSLDMHTQARIAHEKLRFSREVRKRLEKLRKDAQKSLKISRTKKRTKLDPAFRENLKHVLNRFQIAKREEKVNQRDRPPLNTLAGIKDPVLEMGPEFNPLMLEDSENANILDLTMNASPEEGGKPYGFRQVESLVNYLINQGQQAELDTLFQGKVDREQLMLELLETLEPIKDQFTLEEGGWLKNKLVGAADAWSEYDSRRLQLLFIMRALDGYTNLGPRGVEGPFEKFLFNPIEESFTSEQDVLEAVDGDIKPLLEHIRSRMLESGPADKHTDDIPFPKKLQRKHRKPWNYQRRMMVASNMGNQYQIDALTRGYDWGEWKILPDPHTGKERPTWIADRNILDRVTATLTKDDWLVVQQFWRSNDRMWPLLNGVHKRVYGFEKEKVTPTPITVTTADGEVLTLDGGYIPIKFDREGSPIRQAQADSADEILVSNANLSPTVHTYQTFMTERTDSGGKPIRLDFNVLFEHIAHAARYIAYEERLTDIASVFANERIRETIIQKFGINFYDQIIPALSQVARPEPARLNVLDRILNGQRNLSTKFILGINANVAMKQPFSIFGLINDIGFWPVLRGVWKAYKNPIEARAKMHEKSQTMKTRSKTWDRDIRDTIGSMKQSFGPIWTIAAKMNWPATFVEEVIFSFIKMMDFLTVLPGWWGAHEKALQRGMSEEEAVLFADKAITSTQPSSRTFDLSAWQRDQVGAIRMFTMFMTFTMKFGNRTRMYNQGLQKGKVGALLYIRHFLWERFLPPIFMMGMMDMLTGDLPDEEDDWKRYAVGFFTYQFVGYPFIREVATAISYFVTREGFQRKPTDSPAFTGVQLLMEMFNKSARAMQKDDQVAPCVKAWADLFSFGTGIPASRIAYRTIEGIRQATEEPEGDIRNVVFPDHHLREER